MTKSTLEILSESISAGCIGTLAFIVILSLAFYLFTCCDYKRVFRAFGVCARVLLFAVNIAIVAGFIYLANNQTYGKAFETGIVGEKQIINLDTLVEDLGAGPETEEERDEADRKAQDVYDKYGEKEYDHPKRKPAKKSKLWDMADAYMGKK